MMGIIDLLETRAGVSLEDPNVPIAAGVTLMDLFGGSPTYTGRYVNDATALTSSAVYAAVNIISGTVGSLPLKVYRRLDRGKEEARDHYLWPLLHDAPNSEMSAVNCREAQQGHLLMRGNAYSRIDAKRNGEITALWPLHPASVSPRRTPSGTRIYIYTNADGTQEVYADDDILHIAGLGGGDGIGYGVITLARQSIALGLSMEEYAARFFGNSAQPRGILSAPEQLSPEARLNLKESWQAAYGGLDNAHRVAVLDEGLKFQALGMSNEDSEFLASRQFSVREIARWFNIPPHKIRDLEDATFSNIEAQNVEFVVDTLLPWLRRWEQAITQQLLTPKQRAAGYFVEFVVDGLLRGDSAARSQLYQTLFNMGAVTPNEIRAMENMDRPVDGGDVAFIQLNMVPLDRAEDMVMGAQDDGGDATPPEGDGDPEEDPEVARAAQVGLEKRAAHSPSRRLALRATFLPLLREAARRLVRREVTQLKKLVERYLQGGEPGVFLNALQTLYEEWPKDVQEIMGPVLRAYASQIRDAAYDEVPKPAGDGEVGDAWVDSYLDTFSKRYSTASRRQLTELAQRPVEGDTTLADVVDARLERWDEGLDGTPRSEIIANREATQMLNAVTKVTFAAAGVLALRWMTIGDNCPMCDALDGTVMSIDIPFVQAGDTVGTDEKNITPTGSIGHPPLHDGCDCIIVPG